jgi:hypothetical protein
VIQSGTGASEFRRGASNSSTTYLPPASDRCVRSSVDGTYRRGPHSGATPSTSSPDARLFGGNRSPRHRAARHMRSAGYEPPLPDPEASRPSPFRTYWRHAAQPDPPIYRGVGANFSWFQPGGAAVGAARTRRGVADAGWAAAALAASYATAPRGAGSHTQVCHDGHRWRISCPAQSQTELRVSALPTIEILPSWRPRWPPLRRAMQ